MGRLQESGDIKSTRTRKQLHGSRSTISLNDTVDAFRTQPRKIGPGGTQPSSKSLAYNAGEPERVFLSSSKLAVSPSRSTAQLNERRREDRDSIVKLQDRISLTSKHTYIAKVLRAYDPDGKGTLTPDAMHSALSRLNLGLQPEEISRVVSRLRTPGNDQIAYQSLFTWAHNMAPLGARQMDDGGRASPDGARGMTGTRHDGARGVTGTGRLPKELPLAGHDQGDPNMTATTGSRPHTSAVDGTACLIEEDGPISQCNNSRTRAPWEPLHGRMRAWNWELRPQGLAGVTGPAEPGSYEQKKQDSLLISLLSDKLTQSLDKLRATFRKWDASRNGQLSREEFVGALEAMHLNVPRPQLDRLFDMADINGSGEVDYVEFARTFDSGSNARNARDMNPTEVKAADATRAPLASTLSPPITPTEVDTVVRSPLSQQLATKLACKAGAAHAVFGAYDANGDGYLSLSELTTCCQALVPGMSERHVAALLTASDPSGDGYLNYREFVGRLVDSAPAHPRMMNLHMAGAAAGRMGEPRNTWGQSPLFTTALKPSSLVEAEAQSLRASTAPLLPDGTPSVYTSIRRRAPKPQEDGKFSNTVWTKEDLPVPGYTGVLQPHLRTAGPARPTTAERRLKMHQIGIEPLITSLTLHMESETTPSAEQCNQDAGEVAPPASPPRPEASASPVTTPSRKEKCGGGGGGGGGRGGAGLLPWDVTGAPALPAERRTRAVVAGARHQLDESQPLSSDTPTRRPKREVTGTAALRDLIPHRWGNPAGDPELPGVHSSLPDMSRSARGGWRTAESTSDNPSPTLGTRPATTTDAEQPKLRKGKARFIWLSNLDTTHITSVLPTCSQWSDPHDTWVRKSDSDFMCYQQQDRVRKARKEEAGVLREGMRAAEHAVQEETRMAQEEATKNAIIQAKGMVKARYVERQSMFDDARAAHVPHANGIFNRSLFFSDHVLLDPVLARA